MATITGKNYCVKCKKPKTTVKCSGCSQDFCFDHISEHRNELSEQLGRTEDQYNELRIEIDEKKIEPQKHELMKKIDEWERESIEKIRQVANEVRHKLLSCIITFVDNIDLKLKELSKQLIHYRKENDFADPDIQFLNEQLKRLKDILNNPPNIKIEYDSTYFIDKIRLTTKASLLCSENLNVNVNWVQNGITVAGGNGYGSGMNQIYNSWGLCVDDDQTIYIADYWNHRMVEWKFGATTGRVVAGGNGEGNRSDQLSYPTDVIIDKKIDSLIVCDYVNKRVVRWPRQNDTYGETVVSNIGCWGLAMDDDGFIYVADYDKHAVRRYRIGENQGTIVAGGNGQGNRLDQLNCPRYVFIDRDHSIYVSDYGNHRVMKWMKGAKQGIVVAGGQGQGNSLTQLSCPFGIVVDRLGTVYVADYGNHRIMCWSQGATQANAVLGGNGRGSQSNQFYGPIGLTVLSVPFLTPALRRHALPYVPATREQLDNIFNLLKQYSTKQRQHLIDLGSGDGRIVFEAIQQGFPRATGIEINRVLVYYARLKAYLSNQGKICQFKRANLWKHDLSKYDTIVLFGVDTMMEPLLKKLSKEITNESIVITCRYQFPIKFDRTLGEGIDAVWLYNSQTIRSQMLKN
ncbi:unnamed protein product [Rotaria sp. Silwood2]|nr:unnamed protein product [Rotaria sp. Silwood2]